MPADRIDHPGDREQRAAPLETGRNHEVGAPALLGIRDLAGGDRRQTRRRHPRTGAQALGLNEKRGADHRDRVDPMLAAGLVE